MDEWLVDRYGDPGCVGEGEGEVSVMLYGVKSD